MESRPNGAATDVPTPPSLTAAWRAYLDGASKARSTAVLLTLPSGMAVRAKRPTLLEVLASGRIPDTLAAKVEALITKAQQQGTGAIQDAMDEQRTADPAGFMSTYLALLDVVWCEAVVEPKFARDPGPNDALTPDTLPVEAVPIGDKTYLFTWAQGVDADLATFPDRAAGTDPAVGTGQDRPEIRPGSGEPAGRGYEG